MAVVKEHIISEDEYQEAEAVKNDYFKLTQKARRTFRDLLKVGLLISELYQDDAPMQARLTTMPPHWGGAREEAGTWQR